MKKTLAVLSILTLLTACGPEARPALTDSNSAELTSFKATPSAARLYYTSGQIHQHHLLNDTAVADYHRGKVTIDGKEVADVGPKEFVVLDVKAGHHEISWMSANDSAASVTPKTLQINVSNNTIKVLTLEFFDEKSAGADMLMGFGAIGGAVAGSMGQYHTEIGNSASTDALNGRSLVYYKKL